MAFSWDAIQVVMADANSFGGGIRQRPHHLARGLAQDLGVLYIEEPGNWLTVGLSPEKPSSNWHRWKLGPQQVEEKLWVWTPPPGMPVGYWSEAINRRNHALYARRLQQLTGDWPPNRLLFVACNPLAVGWLEHLQPLRSVYDCCDEFQYFPMPSKRPEVVLAIERQLMAQVEVVAFSSATTLRHKLAARRTPRKGGPRQVSPQGIPRKAVLIRNGCEVAHFATADPATSPMPADLAPIHAKGPVLLYYGSIAAWFDEGIVADLCKLRPDWQVVLIGPIFRQLPKLRGLKNCTLMGKRPYATLPDYLAHAQVALMPQLVVPVTDCADHVKVYEYIAAGKGIVGTELTELQSFREFVHRAPTAREWVPLIEAIMHEPPEMAAVRRRFAQQNSWDIRVAWFKRTLLHQEKAVVDARREAQRAEEEQVLAQLRYANAQETKAMTAITIPGSDEAPASP